MTSKKELKARIDALEAQLQSLPQALGAALRDQLPQRVSRPGFPEHGADLIRLGSLAARELEYKTTPLYPLRGSEWPLAPGGEGTLTQDATRLCGWLAVSWEVRFEWADKAHLEDVSIQFYLSARHGPVREALSAPFRGAMLSGRERYPLVLGGLPVYVGSDCVLQAVVGLEKASPGVLTECKVIVHHAA